MEGEIQQSLSRRIAGSMTPYLFTASADLPGS